MKIYTKTGDDGTTGTLGQGRRPKSDLLIQVLGEVDELNAHLSTCDQSSKADTTLTKVFDIQCRLFDIGSEIASLSLDQRYMVDDIAADYFAFETDIDKMDGELQALTNFIIPGGSPESCSFHLARAVCRRVERSIVDLRLVEPSLRIEVVKYFNRLSDWLFVRARFENHAAGIPDRIWVKKND
jgi:cob(I)alamin adenosyltransferase